MYTKVTKYLNEFALISKVWFEKATFLDKFDVFFQTFFDKGINQLDWYWVKELGNHIHSFNSLPLARTRATNDENNKIDKLKETFLYLTQQFETEDKTNEINERLKNVLSNKKYKLKYWGISAISEIIGQKFANDFVFYNHRDREAIKFLEISIKEERNDKEWGKYIKYQHIIKPIIELYKEIVLPKSESNYPIAIQVDQFLSWVYETKVSSNTLQAIEIEGYINSISIANYFSIQNIEFKNLKSKEIYLLGENGAGKTILLQAIFLALKGNFIKSQIPSTISEVLNVIKSNPLLELKADITDDFVISNAANDFSYIPNVFAYGTNRNNQTEYLKKSHDFMSLFSQNYKLIHPVDWLSDLFYKKNVSKIDSGFDLENAIDLLKDLLHQNVMIEVKAGEKNTEVFFSEKETLVSFEQLADGYRSILIWVVDMISRLFDMPQNSNAHLTSELDGIVLIDELDLFLHPKWSYEIVRKLRSWFPKVQFIISTHSPVLTLGASKDAIFYKVYKEDGNTKIASPKIGMQNMTANSLITSLLWQLDTFTTDDIKPEFISSDDYIYSQIHKKISENIKKQPNLTDEKVMKLIEEELDKIQL